MAKVVRTAAREDGNSTKGDDNVLKRSTEPRRVFALCGLAVFSAVLAFVLAFQAGGAKAAGGASLAGTPTTVTRLSSGSQLPQGVQLNLSTFACSNMTDLPQPPDCSALGLENMPASGDDDGGDNGSVSADGVPNVGNTGLRQGAGNSQGNGGPSVNFNGINDDTNVSLIGGHLTPPDQGLCVGPASAFAAPLGVPGNTSVVIESVNEAFTVYSKSGQVLFGPYTLADLFSDPYSSGDVSCNYDPATHSFFFTEIGAAFVGDIGFYGTGLVVMNASGYSSYGIDTAETGFCLPDFPQHGFDNNAFYISVREFCGANQDDFQGANLYALSKSDLVNGASMVHGAYWQGLTDQAGIPVDGLRPAIGDGTNTEYLLNAVAYDATGFSTNSSNLDEWQVTGDQNVNTAPGSLTLSGRTVNSEPYAYPVDATSTGDGSCSYYHNVCEITSESFIDPVDSRLEQVQFANGHLYTSLDSAVTVGHSPTMVDGAAWFDVNASTGTIAHQGYVAVAGTNLLMPSLMRSAAGHLVMGFSLTSPTLNPSTGYAVLEGQDAQGDQGSGFGPVQLTGIGSAPHKSYSPIVYGRHRWGDYSAVALDPSSGNVWMANEYVPAADQGGSDIADNWGTRVWALAR